MSEENNLKRRKMMKLAAVASGSTISPVALSEGVSASNSTSREALVDDLEITNTDDVERTFDVRITKTSGNAEADIFSEEITVASGESRSYKTAFPRGKKSQVSVTLDNGRTETRDTSVVGQHPLIYGFEVVAKPELLEVFSRHIDPGPNEWSDN